MGLSDSRQEPATGYLFLLAVSAPASLPGSSTDLSTRAAPSHPEELSDDCSRPLLHLRLRRIHHSLADWPLLSCVTGPKRVRLRCGSRVRLARLRQWNHSHSRLRGYLSNGQLTRYPPFRILDRPGLSWRSRGRRVRRANINFSPPRPRWFDRLLATSRARRGSGSAVNNPGVSGLRSAPARWRDIFHARRRRSLSARALRNRAGDPSALRR